MENHHGKLASNNGFILDSTWEAFESPAESHSVNLGSGICIHNVGILTVEGMHRLLANECWQREQLESRRRRRKITGLKSCLVWLEALTSEGV